MAVAVWFPAPSSLKVPTPTSSMRRTTSLRTDSHPHLQRCRAQSTGSELLRRRELRKPTGLPNVPSAEPGVDPWEAHSQPAARELLSSIAILDMHPRRRIERPHRKCSWGGGVNRCVLGGKCRRAMQDCERKGSWETSPQDRLCGSRRPESVYLSTVIKTLETAEPLTVDVRSRL
jgi:hypothetical protein